MLQLEQRTAPCVFNRLPQSRQKCFGLFEALFEKRDKTKGCLLRASTSFSKASRRLSFSFKASADSDSKIPFMLPLSVVNLETLRFHSCFLAAILLITTESIANIELAFLNPLTYKICFSYLSFLWAGIHQQKFVGYVRNRRSNELFAFRSLTTSTGN